MRKQRSVIVIACVLCLAGAAQASIGSAQYFEIGAINQVDWLGGIGSATAMNKISFEQNQMSSNFHSGFGSQRQFGTLTQSGTATGLVGPSTSQQDATLKGDQSLLTSGGRFGGTYGTQSLEGILKNTVVKPEGAGTVSGTQSFVGGQQQGFSTLYGGGGQSQYIEVLQQGNITTGANTDPTVISTVNFQLGQSQITGAY
ncbi:MAG: hypothetical protein ACM3VT_06205 [Solirubrobacterales bacterium]